MTRWLETDTNTNKDISAAVSIGVYTADTDRTIYAQAFIDQAAGNGDYVFYMTLQIGGAGSAYVLLPKTTATAASGETAIAVQSGPVQVRSGDVLTVYVDGLAGDTTNPDTIVRWYELAALKPTTADRTLDVAATGEAGIDLTNILQASAPTTLTNITIPAVTTLTTNSDKTGYSLTVAPPTAGAVADAVWGEAIADHLTAGSTGLKLNTAAAATGSGAVTTTLTVNDGTNPLDGVEVWVTTDAPGSNMVASGTTDALGQVVFQLDAGAYYVWKQLSGYNFTNPESLTVSA